MATYHADKPFITPPELQGQIVDVSFSIDIESEVILTKTVDRSDGSTEYEAFVYPDSDEEFEPWNGAPTLGRSLGVCSVSAD